MEVRGKPIGVILFFHYMGPRDGTQVVSLVGKCLYPHSHLTSPRNIFKKYLFWYSGHEMVSKSGYLLCKPLDLRSDPWNSCEGKGENCFH